MKSLEGSWNVRRTAGVLPPIGVSKLVWGHCGYTALFGVPVAFFTIDDGVLRYRGLPMVDELTEGPEGTWRGRGLLFGREFCRFELALAS